MSQYLINAMVPTNDTELSNITSFDDCCMYMPQYLIDAVVTANDISVNYQFI